MLHAPGVWLVAGGPPPHNTDPMHAPWGPHPTQCLPGAPPSSCSSSSPSAEASRHRPSSSSSSVPAGGPTYTYLMRDAT